MKSLEQAQLLELERQVRATTRELAARSLRAFGLYYLSHHLERRPSRMHEELFPLLERLKPGDKLAIAAPRGSAKSTLVTLLFILWSICHRKHRYIVILSHTADKAAEFLDNVKRELYQNERLASDFPEACQPGGRADRPPRWRKDQIITRNDVRIAALSAGQNIRGTRHGEVRPDLIILDDVEAPENTGTAEARAKLSDWFTKSILKAGTSQTQFLMVGTIQHYDSLLARSTDPEKNPWWNGRVYRSVIRWSPRPELWEKWVSILRQRERFQDQVGPDAARAFYEANEAAMREGTEVLWPEVEDYYALMAMRESEGPASFDSEKQNEPVNPQDCLFLEAEFVFWDDRLESEGELIASLEKNARFFGACDPSLGRQGVRADDSAIITLLRDAKSGTLYVLDADIARRKPDEIIDRVLAYGRQRKYRGFGFETNQFQSVLADELKRRSNQAGLHLPVRDIQHSTDKRGRIQSLQPLVRSGAIQFCKRQRTLLDQLRLFPKAAHDDGPDALEMAVETARKGSTPDWSKMRIVKRRVSVYV